MKIVVATDGSSHAEMSIRTLVDMGTPSDAEVFVLHVKEPPHYLVTPAVPPSYQNEWHRVERELRVEADEAASLAISQAEQLLANVGQGVHSMIREGHPADEIVRLSEEISADLVVVGSKGLSGIMVFLLGSVSQKVIKYAPCSVLLAKSAGYSDNTSIARVILATDGSDNAVEAARFLSSFRLPDGAEITIVNVLAHLPRASRLASSPVLEQVRQSGLENAQRLLDHTLGHLTTRATVTTATREGNPAEQILQASSEMNADLVVVGSKGLSGIQSFLLGSVSQKVSRYSDRSVLLVKMRQGSTPSDGQCA